jgi:hypothetical protein
MSDARTQREERVCQHLAEARASIEQDILYTTDPTLKRIEADAAAIVTLNIVAELLPVSVQEHVRAIIKLHESTWNNDEVPGEYSATPRKPLGERLFNRIACRLRMPQEKDPHKQHSTQTP